MDQALRCFDRYNELQYGYQTDLLRILYYDLPQDYSETYASYEYPKLCTILNGQKHVRINGTQEQFVYDNSEMVLLPPRSLVEMKIPTPTRALVFELSDQLVERLQSTVEEELSTSIILEQSGLLRCGIDHRTHELNETIQRIRRYLCYDDKSKRFLVDLAAQELTYHLLHIQGAEQILHLRSNDPVQQAIREINEQIGEIHHVRDLASHYQMSHTNFTSRFKKLTGLSPREYITNRKLEEAERRLERCTVTEVAMDLHYDNISHFIGLFKKKYGMTPKQYQLELQHRRVIHHPAAPSTEYSLH